MVHDVVRMLWVMGLMLNSYGFLSGRVVDSEVHPAVLANPVIQQSRWAALWWRPIVIFGHVRHVEEMLRINRIICRISVYIIVSLTENARKLKQGSGY